MKQKRRKLGRRIQKRITKKREVHFICCATFLLIAVLAGRMAVTAMAGEERKETKICYKSVQIQEGDSLWTIASQYRHGSSMSTSEYIEQLKQMNCLKQDTIHAGQYLTVVYFPQ